MKTIQYLETVESTQSYAKEHHLEFDLDKLCFVSATQQKNGIGTRGKSWYSPSGQNIYVTYFFKLKKPAAKYINLAQVISLSILKVLKKLDFEPTLKWPNDIMLSGKKCGGVLCEITDNPTCAFVGLGLNINMPKSSLSNIDIPATSLGAESGKIYSVKDTLDLCTDTFKKDLALYEEKGFAPFYEVYKENMPYIGYEVFVENKKIGKSFKIEKDGSLQIINEHHKIHTVSSGSMKIH